MTRLTRLAVLAHEVRSPVAALVAIAEAYPVAAAERRRRLLVLASGAAVSIERLLADAAVTSLRVEQVDAGGLVTEVAETAALGGARVVAAVDEGLLLEGDRERLRQALVNLISNAVGHSPEGGTVHVSAQRRGAFVVLAVADEGEGLSAAELTKIFEPGVRLTDSRPGSGLGLAVVRSIAEAHGGEVEVASTRGRGATFRLVLPGAFGAG